MFGWETGQNEYSWQGGVVDPLPTSVAVGRYLETLLKARHYSLINWHVAGTALLGTPLAGGVTTMPLLWKWKPVVFTTCLTPHVCVPTGLFNMQWHAYSQLTCICMQHYLKTNSTPQCTAISSLNMSLSDSAAYNKYRSFWNLHAYT
jgi:hypothetical protein